MTNLLRVLPDFDLKPYSHILPSLEKALVSTGDLLTLEPVDVAKRAHVPPGEVKKLLDDLVQRLRTSFAPSADTSHEGESPLKKSTLDGRKLISTLDVHIDATLNGGIPAGYLTEVVGESAVGKTQFLLTLLLAVQLPPPLGLGKSALYISTEAPLPTSRLAQILEAHPRLSTLGPKDKPSLARVHSTHIHDLEAQDHILRYQVPVIVARHDVGIVILDSVAANYRPEFGKSESGASKNAAVSFGERSTQLIQLGALLRSLAQKNDLAVVVANQVADRFQSNPSHSRHSTQISQQSRQDSPLPPSRGYTGHPKSITESAQPSDCVPLISTSDPLSFDHQQAFTTGWGDEASPFTLSNGSANLKTPSLGLTWTNQLATRIALLKEPIYEDKMYAPGEERSVKGWRRRVKVVFSAWGKEGQTEFEVIRAGVKSCQIGRDDSL
ncbi:DNA repair protein rhp57 [Acrodontium crateriforme]|uniref:DNA repair protein rhp57 n=1 Tax=Acrodontium crateriforme TaxID=150365 RepID=A0AAQ3M4D6_9PEZI|nr:DNA repair protein rhp57 [Acrodontium crateriforme]